MSTLSDSFMIVPLVISAITIIIHVKIFSYWKARGIPGPTPWPILGTNIYYFFWNKVDLELEWQKLYGNTFGLFEGYTPLLRTVDPELIKQVFVKQHHSFTDRHDPYVHNEVQKRWLLWSRGSLWANQRALVSPMFSASKMRNMMDAMRSSVDQFIKHVEERLSRETHQKSTQFNKNDLSALTLDVIGTSFFGLKLDTYKVTKQKDKFIQAALDFANFPYLRFILWNLTPRPLAKLLSLDIQSPDRLEYFDRLSKGIIKERRENQNSSKRQDVIQMLIDAKLPDTSEQVFSNLEDKEKHYNADIDHKQMEQIQRDQMKQATQFKKFSDLDIRGQMNFFFIAGFETTASSLSFAFHELAYQKELQDKLVAELRENFGHTGEKLKDSNTAEIYTQLLNLRELDAFISELLRLYGPILEHTRRVTEKNGVEVAIGNKTLKLPKGTPIAVSVFNVHRDPENFERPDEFDVSRFYPENRGKIKAGSYVPFGLGPRFCVGMRFALTEIKVALAKILLRFEVLPDDDCDHPPRFNQNLVFLQFAKTKFRLSLREA